MKTQYSFMLFFLCLNITSYLIIEAQIPLAMGGGLEKEKVEELAEQSGFETVASGWNPAGLESIPILGDIVRSFNLIVKGLNAVFLGFPNFLEMIGAPALIVWALRLLMTFTFGWFLLELITGRSVSD